MCFSLLSTYGEEGAIMDFLGVILLCQMREQPAHFLIPIESLLFLI
jgi:hypothetical protein